MLRIKEEEVINVQSSSRDAARLSGGRLIYDCFCSRVWGEEVFCAVGDIQLSSTAIGSLPLDLVLSGDKPAVCQKCKFFDDGTKVKKSKKRMED